jgi:hypothetical protein
MKKKNEKSIEWERMWKKQHMLNWKLNDKLKKNQNFPKQKKNNNKKNQDQILKLKILRGSFENLKRQVRKN